MNAWSPRLETNARLDPLGAHCGSSASPFAAKRRRAGAEPSTGTVQIAWSRMNATASPAGTQSARRRPPGASPGRQRTGLTRPESSARPVVKAGWETRRSSYRRDRRRARTPRIDRRASSWTLVSSWPSSRSYAVICRGRKSGPSATHRLRRPASSSAQAMRLPVGAAMSSEGNGYPAICASVNGGAAGPDGGADWAGRGTAASSAKTGTQEPRWSDVRSARRETDATL